MRIARFALATAAIILVTVAFTSTTKHPVNDAKIQAAPISMCPAWRCPLNSAPPTR